MRRLLKSFGYAFKGIYLLFRYETNAQIHLLATALVIAMGFYFSLTTIEWCIISIAIASVLAAEGFNTAIEKLTNLVSPNFHPLAGQTKDIAAGAVLLVALGAIVIGLLIFGPKIIHLIYIV